VQPSLARLAAYFLRLGTIGFGGPIALVSYMKTDLVDKLRWFSQEEYDDGFAFSQAAPGPIAPQLAMYLAFLRFGVLGATLVVVAFIFTPFMLVVILSFLYVQYGQMGWIQSLLLGMSPAVVAIVIHATWKLGKGMLKTLHSLIIAVIAFVLAAVFRIEISFIIIGAGLLGIAYVGMKSGRLLGTFIFSPAVLVQSTVQPVSEWGNCLLVKLSLFFFKAGALTFGSGYVVVAFLQQGVVEQYHWLTMREFLDGVAIGQITPGPVVIAAAFVGYLTHGVAGSLVSIVSVLLPIYLITIVGSPLLRRYRTNPYVQAFICNANAAALGTIVSVAYTMALGAVSDWVSAGIMIASLGVLVRWDTPSVVIIAMAGGLGLLLL